MVRRTQSLALKILRVAPILLPVDTAEQITPDTQGRSYPETIKTAIYLMRSKGIQHQIILLYLLPQAHLSQARRKCPWATPGVSLALGHSLSWDTHFIPALLSLFVLLGRSTCNRAQAFRNSTVMPRCCSETTVAKG